MQSKALHSETLRASGAVTAQRIVKFDGAQATVIGEKVLGVAVYDAADQALYSADVIGTAIVEAGAAIAVGDDLKTDATGRAIPQAGVGVIFADALQAAGAAGEKIEILLR